MAAARGPATIVLDASNPAVTTPALLEALRAALRPLDHLLVIVPSETSGESFRTLPDSRIRRISDLGELVSVIRERHALPLIAVDGSIVLAGRAPIGELLAAHGDLGATVAVPSSNAGPWPQCPSDTPTPSASRAEIRDFASARRAAGGSPFLSVGPTSMAFAAVAPGALPEVAELLGSPAASGQPLCAALEAALRHQRATVAIVPGVYVHANAGVPQVSACLIMKDEEAELADCLASLRPLVDEIVIYDTGSSDGSVALARSLGATVIEGEWRDDFAWARNKALAAARGTWVLSIDADERLELDDGVVAEIRGLLGDDPPIERFVIDLYDLQGSVHAPVRSGAGVPMARLFRRSACQWVGALHEQPEARPGRPTVRSINLPGIRFLHRGYLDEYIRDKDKWARNLAVATAGLDQVPTSDKECFDLGRSLRSVGEHQRAFALFERAAELGQNVVITRGALEFAVLTLCETGQASEAAPYLERLREQPGGDAPARYLQGWVHIHLRRWEEACACFEGITDYDDNFTGFRAESVSLALALAYRGLGRRRQAVDAAIETLRCNDQALEAWAVLFDSSEAGAPTDAEVAASIAPDRLVPLAARLQVFPAAARDRLFEAVWQVRPGDRVALAVASQLAPSLSVERQVVWSGRLRAHGLASLCPLRKLADDGTRTVAGRATALAAGLANPGSEDLEGPLEDLAALLLDDELSTLLDRSLDEGGGAAGPLIVGGATTAARCVAIVQSLHSRGFGNEALSVLAHSAELDGDGTRRALAAAPALAASLRAAARLAGRQDLGGVLPDAA